MWAAYVAKGQEELPFDFEHDLFREEPGPKPARGWWKMALREDGIWAVGMRYSPEAFALVQTEGYHHSSPTGHFDPDTKRLQDITTFALSNRPATNGQKPILATEGEGDTTGASASGADKEQAMLEKIKAALGLKAEATDEEIEAAITSIKAAATEAGTKATEAQAVVTAKDAEIAALKATDTARPLAEFRAKVMESVGLQASAKDEDFAAAIVTLKAKAPEAEKVVALQAKVGELERFVEDTRIGKLVASVAEYVTPAIASEVEDLARKLPESTFLATVKRFPKVKAEPEKPIGSAALDARNGSVLVASDEEYLASIGAKKGDSKWTAFEAMRALEIEEKKARKG